MSIPKDLRYTASHEWARDNKDGTFTIGITSHAQEQLGDVVFVEVQAVGDDVKAGDAVGVVESVKAMSDIYAPMDGTVLAVNPDIEDLPELVNSEPYGKGWLYTLKPDDEGAYASMLNAEAYGDTLGS